MSVIVPIDVPLSITFAPMSGLPVSSEMEMQWVQVSQPDKIGLLT